MNKLTTFFVALICASSIFAADYNCEINGIYYNLNTKEKTAEVTNETGDWLAESYTGSVVIPETVTYNGITYSVTTIGEKAFDGCHDLESIICYATIPPKCGVDVFYYIKRDAKVYVPASVVEDYQNADGWKDLQILPITGEVKNSH